MTLRVQGEGLREREESRVPPGILWGVITGRCFEMRVTGMKGKKSCFLYTPLSSYPAYRPSGTRRVGVFPTPGKSPPPTPPAPSPELSPVLLTGRL